MTFARPVHPHPRFKPGAGSSPLSSRERDATPLTAPLGSRLRGNEGGFANGDVQDRAGLKRAPTVGAGIPRCRFAPAPPSFHERGVVSPTHPGHPLRNPSESPLGKGRGEWARPLRFAKGR